MGGPAARIGRGFKSTSGSSCRHKRLQRSTVVSMSPTRRSLATPSALSSACVPGSSAPGPIPKMTRPSARRSSVATACAIEIGCRSSGKRTAVPMATRLVAPATAASMVNGSPRGRASSESPTQTESYPEASARRAASMTNARSLSLHSSTSRDGSRRPVAGDCFAVLRLFMIAVSWIRGLRTQRGWPYAEP
jgi:hypothetical protein